MKTDCIAFGLDTKGEIGPWLEVAKEVAHRSPIAATVLAASMAAPMLHLVGQEAGLLLDVTARTTCGKTLLLHLAASVWGNPDALVQGWNATRAGLRDYLQLGGVLPRFLDCREMARGATARACRDGLWDARWTGIALSNGEARPTALFERIRPREAVVLEGEPLGGSDARLADRVRAISREHYGVMGAHLRHHLYSTPLARARARELVMDRPRDYFDAGLHPSWAVLEGFGEVLEVQPEVIRGVLLGSRAGS